MPAHWLRYFAVDDIAAAVVSTNATGGVVMRQPFDVPNVGRIAPITDPGGAPSGVVQPFEGA